MLANVEDIEQKDSVKRQISAALFCRVSSAMFVGLGVTLLAAYCLVDRLRARAKPPSRNPGKLPFAAYLSRGCCRRIGAKAAMTESCDLDRGIPEKCDICKSARVLTPRVEENENGCEISCGEIGLSFGILHCH